MNRIRICRVLKGTHLLREVSDQEIEDLVPHVRHQGLEAGEVLFQKDAVTSCVYIIDEGRVRISSVSRDGSEFILGMVESGELFGELALVDGSRRAVSAIADQDTCLLSIERRDFQPILEKNPKCAMAVLRSLSKYLSGTINRLESIALHDAKRRLWFKLVDLGRRYGQIGSEPGSLRVEHGLSQEKLADSVGLTRVMVSRQLGIWREQGLIEHGRGFVEIRDPAALEDYVWRDGPDGGAVEKVAEAAE